MYLSNITVTNTYQSFTYMVSKTSWHRHGTKLHHCHITLHISLQTNKWQVKDKEWQQKCPKDKQNCLPTIYCTIMFHHRINKTMEPLQSNKKWTTDGTVLIIRSCENMPMAVRVACSIITLLQELTCHMGLHRGTGHIPAFSSGIRYLI